MPRFIPTAAAAVPIDWTNTGISDRGGFLYDTVTKSTKQKPSVYVEADQCDEDTYAVGQMAMNINENSDLCLNGLNSAVSIKARVPLGATAQQITDLFLDIVPEFANALAALEA